MRRGILIIRLGYNPVVQRQQIIRPALISIYMRERVALHLNPVRQILDGALQQLLLFTVQPPHIVQPLLQLPQSLHRMRVDLFVSLVLLQQLLQILLGALHYFITHRSRRVTVRLLVSHHRLRRQQTSVLLQRLSPGFRPLRTPQIVSVRTTDTHPRLASRLVRRTLRRCVAQRPHGRRRMGLQPQRQMHLDRLLQPMMFIHLLLQLPYLSPEVQRRLSRPPSLKSRVTPIVVRMWLEHLNKIMPNDITPIL
jgi:hypothetical protein